MKRYALIPLKGTTQEQLERYLPGNYEAIGVGKQDADAYAAATVGSADALLQLSDCLVIAGDDVAGWSLDGYVIPRLASGLHTCREIDLSHPVMKTIPEPVR